MTRALAGIALVVAASAAAGAERSPAGVEGEVRRLLAAQVEAWNRGDLEGFMAGYWRSDELVFCSGASLTRGWDATLERYRKRYQAEGREMGELRFAGLEVQALGPDAAFARGEYRLRMRDGQQPHGRFTLVLRRTDGAFRIVHDHTSAAE